MAVEKVYAIDRVAKWKIQQVVSRIQHGLITRTWNTWKKQYSDARTLKARLEEVCFVMDQANIIESIRKMAYFCREPISAASNGVACFETLGKSILGHGFQTWHENTIKWLCTRNQTACTRI